MSSLEDATRVAARALATFDARAWDALVELLDDEGLAGFQQLQLATLLAFMRLKAGASAGTRGMRGMGVSLDPQIFEAHATTLVPVFPGSPSVGELAALDPRDFVSRWFAISYPPGSTAAQPDVLKATSHGADHVDVEFTGVEPGDTPWSDVDGRTVVSLHRSASRGWVVQAPQDITIGPGLVHRLFQDYQDRSKPPT